MKFISKLINYFILLIISIIGFSLSVYADDNIFSINGNYYNTLEDAVDNVSDGDTIIFEKDYYTDNFIILKIQKKINIDLKGHIFSSSSCYGNFYVYSGDVTFYDSVGGGKVVNTAFENANAKTFMVYKKYTTYISKLTLNNINVISNSYNIYVEKNSEVILNNIKVTGKYNFYLGNNINLTINGGTYTSTASTIYGLNVTSVDNASININSGNFTSANDNFLFSTVLANKFTNFINGGTFNKDISDYVASTKKVVTNDGLYTVVDKYSSDDTDDITSDNDDDTIDNQENYCKIYRDQLSQKDSEINDLKKQIEELKAEMASKEAALNVKELELNERENELNTREEELNTRETEINAKEDNVLSQKNFNDIQSAELNRKEEELYAKEEELILKENYLNNKEEEILDKESSLNNKSYELGLRELNLNIREEEYDILYNDYLSKLDELNNNNEVSFDNNKYNVSVDINPLDEDNIGDNPIVGIVESDIDNAILVINDSIEENINIDRDLSVVFNYSVNNVSDSVMTDIINQYGDKYYLNDVFDIGFNVLDKNDNSYLGNITKLNDTIRFTILLPDSLKDCDNDDIYIVKLHDGNYNLLKATISSDRKFLTFETSEFSVFGILSTNHVEEELNNTIILPFTDNNINKNIDNSVEVSNLSNALLLPKTSSSSIINTLSVSKYSNYNNNLFYFIYCLIICTIAFIFGFIMRIVYHKMSLKC